MRFACVAFVLSVCGVAVGQEVSEPVVSVLQPAEAAPVNVEAETVAVINNCTTESSCRSSCRVGFFGRTISRTRTVTQAAVEVPVRVITAPARVFRARRGCCCN